MIMRYSDPSAYSHTGFQVHSFIIEPFRVIIQGRMGGSWGG